MARELRLIDDTFLLDLYGAEWQMNYRNFYKNYKNLVHSWKM